MKYRNQKELEAGLAKWVRILHLQDWEIFVSFVPQSTWDERTQCADCAVRKARYSADIRLASFDTLDLLGAPQQADMERTLVHELLHCVFRAGLLWQDDVCEKGENSHYEHATEQVARTLVELDRA